MDDTMILTTVLSAQALVFILAMLYLNWKQAKERKERDLKNFIAQSLEDWPVERALNDWFETATSDWKVKGALDDWLKTEISEGLTKHTLENWLKTELAKWPVKDVLRKQICEIVEIEVRRQLLDASLKAA